MRSSAITSSKLCSLYLPLPFLYSSNSFPPKTLISENVLFFTNPPFSRLNLKTSNFCSLSTSSASISTNYGGWDDLKLIEHSGHSSKLNRFQNFLVSVGIDDSKHAFMFILGLVSALAISRVRVSTILVLPASVLILAIGYSLGFVRGGGVGFSIKELSRIGSNKGSKEENSRVYAEKLRNSVEFFNELNDKIANLEKEMKGAMNSNFVQVGELESYHNILKNISLDILREKNVIESSTNDLHTPGGAGDSRRESVDNEEVEKGMNQMSNKRKRDLGTSFFDFCQFIGGLFQENSVGSKPNKAKDIVKREATELSSSKILNNQIQGRKIADGTGEESVLDPVSKNSKEDMKIGASPQEAYGNTALDQHGDEILGYGSEEMEEIPRMVGGKSSLESMRNRRTSLDYKDYYNKTNTSKFMNNQRNFTKMRPHNGNEMQVGYDGFPDQLDVGINTRTREFEEETLKRFDGAYMPNSRNSYKTGTYRFGVREREEKLDDSFNMGEPQIGCDIEESSASSSSSMISEDVVFDRHLTDATNLLKQARECLKGKMDEEKAEATLYESARLLSKAISMKPMSLLAVGQLGNTLLLHGELKLKISRELRSLLSTGDSLSRDKGPRVGLKGRVEQAMGKDKIASALINVCEECEELLVEAGRKYRMALSIDGSDVRALYNWGLALTYRAQLIADIGLEAAFDADKIYLAAIDKFDAMMSKSNAFAPDALFRWGMTLRQRSQLRPSNNKEKMKLLHQAIRLFEDALSIDSNNHQVREALSSCISELDYWNF